MLTVHQIQFLYKKILHCHPRSKSFSNSIVSSKPEFQGFIRLIWYTHPLRRGFNKSKQKMVAFRPSWNLRKRLAQLELDILNLSSKYRTRYYSMVDSMHNVNGFAFVFPKGSPLVSDILREIAWLIGDQRELCAMEVE